MSNTTSKSKATVLAQLQALITGLQKQFPNGQFTLGNAVFTTAALVQTFQSLIDAFNVVTTAQANAKVAVAALRATVAKVGPVVLALKRNLASRQSKQGERQSRRVRASHIEPLIGSCHPSGTAHLFGASARNISPRREPPLAPLRELASSRRHRLVVARIRRLHPGGLQLHEGPRFTASRAAASSASCCFISVMSA